MEPNNFEKNIQRKMDELKIPPSDLVWTNIEKRIPKKHKDRKAIFIILFLILFLFTGGYWLFNTITNNNQQQNHPLNNLLEKNKPTSSAVLQSNNQDSSSDYSIVSSESPEKTDLAVTPKKKTSLTFIQRKANRHVIDKKQKDIFKVDLVSVDQALPSFQNKELENGKDINNNKVDKFPEENKQQKKPGKIAESEIEKIPDQDIAAQYKNDADSLLKKTEEKLPAKTFSKDLKKHRWILGFKFSGGMSFISNDLLNINNRSADYLSIPNSPGPGSSNSGSGSSARLPVKIINSSAFVTGVFIERNISQKSKISFGINYKYFSTKNKTGNKIDSAQTAFTSTTYINTYRNNFNYLELPLSLKFQLTNNNSLPVYWLAGINISELINSNALQFKNDSGVYYNDNSLFNKTQLGFSTGFFVTLFSHKSTPVNIGPYFSYSATKMANKGFYDKKHFHFIGISAGILFNKK